VDLVWSSKQGNYLRSVCYKGVCVINIASASLQSYRAATFSF